MGKDNEYAGAVDASEEAAVGDVDAIEEEVVYEPVEEVEVVYEPVDAQIPVSDQAAAVDAPLGNVEVVEAVTGPAGSVLDDAATFIGPKADYYIPQFQKLEASGSMFSWNWAAFLGGPLWMLYRKMWVYGLAAYAAAMILNTVLPGFGGLLSLAIWVAFGALGNWAYKNHVETELAKMASLDPATKRAQMATKGGITWIPVIIAGVLMLLFALMMCGLGAFIGLAGLASLK